MVNKHRRAPASVRLEDIMYGKQGPAFVLELLAASRIAQIFFVYGRLDWFNLAPVLLFFPVLLDSDRI
jgi:hypothetical protein